MLNEWKAIHLGDTAERWKQSAVSYNVPCPEEYCALTHYVSLWPLNERDFMYTYGITKKLNALGFHEWSVGFGVEVDGVGKIERKIAAIEQPGTGVQWISVSVDESTTGLSPCLNELLETPGYFVQLSGSNYRDLRVNLNPLLTNRTAVAEDLQLSCLSSSTPCRPEQISPGLAADFKRQKPLTDAQVAYILGDPRCRTGHEGDQ